MGETVEKIYCCDRDNNDNALAAAILAIVAVAGIITAVVETAAVVN